MGQEQTAATMLAALFQNRRRYDPLTYQQIVRGELKSANLIEFLVARVTDGYLAGYRVGRQTEVKTVTYPVFGPWRLPADCRTMTPYQVLSWGNRAARFGWYAGRYDGKFDWDRKQYQQSQGLVAVREAIRQMNF